MLDHLSHDGNSRADSGGLDRNSTQTPDAPSRVELTALMQMMAAAQVMPGKQVKKTEESQYPYVIQHLAAAQRELGQIGERPRVMTDLELTAVVSGVATGLSLRQCAALLGRSPGTLTRRMQRDEAFAARIEGARDAAVVEPLINVARAARKSWRAAAWLVKYLDSKQRPAAEDGEAEEADCD